MMNGEVIWQASDSFLTKEFHGWFVVIWKAIDRRAVFDTTSLRHWDRDDIQCEKEAKWNKLMIQKVDKDGERERVGGLSKKEIERFKERVSVCKREREKVCVKWES